MLSEHPTIHTTARVVKSTIGSWTEIGPNCDLEEVTMGDYSYAIRDVTAIYTAIGKFCSIASHVRINPVQHPMHRVSQHHFTYRPKQFRLKDVDDEAFFNWRRSRSCAIGHDVWIGHAAIIQSGVTIGTGAVIGSGAVVTKDVEPYEVVVGVPAKPVKKRFPDAIIQKLLAIQWWDWSRRELEERFDELMDVENFIKKYHPARGSENNFECGSRTAKIRGISQPCLSSVRK
jgi:phosphonate metabolism protein (transferase hexapeptide repeat family)